MTSRKIIGPWFWPLLGCPILTDLPPQISTDHSHLLLKVFMAMHFNRYYCFSAAKICDWCAMKNSPALLVGLWNRKFWWFMMIYEPTLVIADYDIGFKLTRSGNRFNQRIFHEMGYRFILMVQVFPSKATRFQCRFSRSLVEDDNKPS